LHAPAQKDAPDKRVRLDRWLWAARQYKTRSLASKAVGGGKVRLNDQRAKPGAAVHVGDRVTVRKGPYEFRLIVDTLSEQRGPAREAVKLYTETAGSIAERDARRAQMKQSLVQGYEGKGRPTKKERREIERLRRRSLHGPHEGE
jgi:ribosome-associated heat shock protein Hsp15